MSIGFRVEQEYLRHRMTPGQQGNEIARAREQDPPRQIPPLVQELLPKPPGMKRMAVRQDRPAGHTPRIDATGGGQ
ncbi:hypothetical protein ACIBG7_27130 [Nonomuraea sp. NPDC050328]|uniref:hypothetical protein n=1 Tax=Nonomuraea sp. NPDC050328 TaxID=3364361 RepID=UPI0037B55D5E